MSTSADGQICFGIMLEEGTELPWNSGEYEDDNDMDGWWINGICQFKPEHPIYADDEIYAQRMAVAKTHVDRENAIYLHGKRPTKEEYAPYFNEKNAFEAAHPLPVAEINYCSGEYPMIILAVPTSIKVAYRGSPEAFDPAELVVSPDKVAALIEFCKTYNIEIGNEQPKWWLSSYWG